MSREPEKIQSLIDKAHHDSLRKHAAGEMAETNSPIECVLLLGRLNGVINLLSCLQDDYYTHYIWNASSLHLEQLKAAGLDERFFSDTEDKMRTLRSILIGDSLDFEELYRRLYDEVLGHEVYWKEFFEKQTQDLQRKLRRIESGMHEQKHS